MSLHEALPDHSHDETFLDLVAGLHSLALRFDAVLDRHAPPTHATVPTSDMEPCIVLLLGAIAIRQRLAAALQVSSPPASETVSPSLPTETLLR